MIPALLLLAGCEPPVDSGSTSDDSKGGDSDTGTDSADTGDTDSDSTDRTDTDPDSHTDDTDRTDTDPDSDTDSTATGDSDTDTDSTETADTDTDTGDSDTDTDSIDSADTGDSDTGDSATDTVGTDSSDTGADTSGSDAETDGTDSPDTGDSDTGGDTEDSSDTGDSDSGVDSADSADSAPDTAETATPPDTGDSAGIETGDTDTAGLDTASETASDTGPDSGAADSTGDTGEILGNGGDDDSDGLIDEIDDPNGAELDDGIRSVSVVDGETWLAYSGSVDTHVLAGADLSELGRIADSFGGYWIPDVDGDGYDDLVANFEESCAEWPYCDYSTGVYSWAELSTTRALGSEDHVALMGSGTDYVEAVSSLTLSDGSTALSFQQLDATSSGTSSTWIVPVSGFSDGRLGQTDAIASFPDISDAAISRDPRNYTDHDGDGVDDLLLFDSACGHCNVAFSGLDVDHLGITSAEARWVFEVQSDGAPREALPVVETDLDGDGYPDFAGVANADGAAFVYSFMGLMSGTSAWTDAHAALSFNGVGGSGDVALIGDLDGDGIEDLAASSAPDDGTTAGRILFLTAADLAAGGTGDADALRWGWYEYGAPGDQVGYALTAADFDQDGVMDLAAFHGSFTADDGTRSYEGTWFWYGVGGS